MLDIIVKLIEEKNYALLKEELAKINYFDLSLILREISDEQKILVYRLLSKDSAAGTFAYLDSDDKVALIKAFTDNELKSIIDDLYVDDAVDLIEEMPSNVVERILDRVDSKNRVVINELLKYSNNSVGSIMTPDYMSLKSDMSIKDAFDFIKNNGYGKENIYDLYVLDEGRRLLGVLGLKDLLLANREDKIKDLMNTNVISVNTNTDKEEAAKMFDKYDFLALPVVDLEKRLVGIVTVDDAMEVLQDENTEDFVKMGAMQISEQSYLKTPFYVHAKNRIIWLLLLMLSSTLTGAILSKYEAAFAAVPVLVSFIPMIMGTGGNCGSQSSTMTIRGLAMDEITFKDIFKVIKKETLISIMVGLILSIVNGVRIVLVYHNYRLALVLGLTLMCTILLAKLLGCILPMAAKKIKLDPAIMAAPLISTIVDTCSILIYFTIATHIMDI